MPSLVNDNNLSLIEEYCELNSTKKEIEAKMKELGAEVRPMLAGEGLQVVDNKYTIECKNVSGRKTLDKKAMEADGIDVASYEKQGAPYTTLTVKELG